MFGVRADVFCYPAGRFDARVVAAVRAAGDDVATTELPGAATARSDPFTLPRVRVSGSDTAGSVLARVQALVRRSTATAEPTRLEVGDLTLDLLSRRVTRQGKDIELRPREFALLEYLMRNAGRVVSKTMILSRIWDYSFDPRTNVVDVLVYRLREKIDHEFEPKLLQTRRGMGYVLEVPAQAGR